jgi:hypothetical protein
LTKTIEVINTIVYDIFLFQSWQKKVLKNKFIDLFIYFKKTFQCYISYKTYLFYEAFHSCFACDNNFQPKIASESLLLIYISQLFRLECLKIEFCFFFLTKFGQNWIQKHSTQFETHMSIIFEESSFIHTEKIW